MKMSDKETEYFYFPEDYSRVLFKFLSSIEKNTTIEGVKVTDKILNDIMNTYRSGLYQSHNCILQKNEYKPFKVQWKHLEGYTQPMLTCSCDCDSTYNFSYNENGFKYKEISNNNCIGIGKNK